MNGNAQMHPHYLIERQRTLVLVASRLNQLLALLRAIEADSLFYEFGLALPPERQILAALSRCAQLHRQSQPETTHSKGDESCS